jgi:hypothetical protein
MCIVLVFFDSGPVVRQWWGTSCTLEYMEKEVLHLTVDSKEGKWSGEGKRERKREREGRER